MVAALGEAADEAESRWAALFDTHTGTLPRPAGPRHARPHGIGRSILPLDQDGDDGHPNAEPHSRQLHLQRTLLQHLDEQCRHEVRQRHADAANAPALRRLDDLEHPETDHTWLWSLSNHKEPVMGTHHFAEVLRIRVGAAGPLDPVPCAL